MDPVAGTSEEQSAVARSGDRCSSCGQSLASDQRYCINCGQRRGKPRFSFSELSGKKKEAPAAAPKQKPRHQRLSQGLAFIAGIATLLLAMGVGVLIGHNSNGNSKVQQASAPQQQVIRLEGGGAVSGSGGNATKKVATHTTQSSTTSGEPVTHIVLSKKQVQAVRKAETNVLGQGAQNLAPPTVQPGSPCAHGAGCQGGKFTGNFFSGGQN
jgi:hypothetical protein